MLNKINYTSEFPKITEETTIKELQAIHKRIWQYAVDNGEKPVTPYIANCAVCEWVYIFCRIMDRACDCDYCPIKWPSGIVCHLDGSMFGMWVDCPVGEVEAKRYLAKCIRDIGFKKKKKLKRSL